jgi:hypothetical protein
MAECQRLELESDLIGAYYHVLRKPPKLQFAAAGWPQQVLVRCGEREILWEQK